MEEGQLCVSMLLIRMVQQRRADTRTARGGEGGLEEVGGCWFLCLEAGMMEEGGGEEEEKSAGRLCR